MTGPAPASPSGVPFSVLLLEDNPTDILLTREALREQSEHLVVEPFGRVAKALDYLAGHTCDVIICDLSLPDCAGEQTFRRIYEAAHGTPIIVYTGADDEQLAARILRAGAQDYLQKGPQIARALSRAVRHAIARSQYLKERQQREHLQREESRVRAIIEASRDGLAVLDPQGMILFVNPAFERLYQRSAADLMGTVHDQPAGTGGAAPQLIRLPDLPGDEERWAEQTLIEFTWFDQPARLLMLKDVTESLRAQKRLQQAQRMESIGRLAGGVAHDFNNMLGVIIGHAELLKADLQEAGPLKDVEDIITAAQRSARLTRQLLGFARKQMASPQVLDLNATLGTMLVMLRQLAGEQINLVWRPGADLHRVRIDPAQLDEILVNLLTNAREAIKENGTVTISTFNTELDARFCQGQEGTVPGSYVGITVADNGPGMTPEMLEHLFEPFFTTKHLSEGAGLGLATVYGIVRQNKSAITVQSTPGRGTTFSLFLPSYLKPEAAPAPEPAGKIPRGTETVLLVEDDEWIRRMVQRSLTSLGYTVLAAASAEEALNLPERNTRAVQLLLTDVIMPGLNGRELAGKMTATYPGLRCLFMSGYTSTILTREGILAEGVQFIEKPFTLAQLANGLRRALA